MRLLFLTGISMVLLACGNSSLEEKKAAIAKSQAEAEARKADEALLSQAQGIFRALPVDAGDSLHVLSPEKVALGKMLYFDNRLSLTGNNSCNSCHDLSKSGVDQLPTSPGDAGKNGDRNSPTVLNAALHTMQFWDGRAKDVEEQAGMPILNPVEMAIPTEAFLVKKLKGIPDYVTRFKAAFPEEKDPLNYTNIENAIAAFERKLLTPSRFDDYLKGNAAALNEQEKRGMKTFIETGCTTCHSGVALGGNMFQKFGVYEDYRPHTGSSNSDFGRFAVTKNEMDKDIFKVPSLRNIEHTYPYFHDGSVKELDRAVSIMAKVQLKKELSKEEVADVVAFLKTLTGDVPEDLKTPPQELAKN